MSLVATLGLTTIGMGAAGAADNNNVDLVSGGNPPGGWIANPDAYANSFGNMTAGQPLGNLIADSGFRPYPHGFPVPNWGSATDFATASLIFGTPQRITLDDLDRDAFTGPAELNSLALRRTLGDGVCRDPQSIDPRNGSCELILGAELLARMIETGSLGGHCFGLAAAAAALYNGQLPANQVGASGLGINAANPMKNPAVQTITRLFGTQYLNPGILPAASEGQSPTAIVETLIRELPSGQVPYVMTFMGEGGGHGITPYAVLDRGEGIFDIAVYDNNFPMRALTVTIDTNTDSFIYTSAVNPNAPNYTWDSTQDAAIALISLEEVLGIQQCPVCRGKDQGTLVAFSSWNSVNDEAIDISLLDTKGRELDPRHYRLLSTLNPEIKKQSSAPLLVVNPGVKFLISVETEKLRTKQPLEVYALSNGASEYLLMEDVAPNSQFVFGVGSSTSVFQSSAPSSPRMLQLYDGKRESIDVNGHPLELPKNVTVQQRWNRETDRVRYISDAKKTLTWNVQLTGIRDTSVASWVGRKVKVPAGSEIVVDYTNATGKTPPQAWVVSKNGDRNPIAMTKITESVLEADRDQIYVSQGPG